MSNMNNSWFPICWIAILSGLPVPASGAEVIAEVDWLVELSRGGITGIALFILMFAAITIAVERTLNLRRRRMIPDGFTERALSLWPAGRFEELQTLCRKQSSTLARMTAFLVEHRDAPPDLLIQGASDLGQRDIVAEQKRAYSLAVIASIAPLLGLLGTIIGMVEAFKLVEVYGDSGGATILAGSISKALVTTVLGLVIAIFSFGMYHYFRFRIQGLGHELDAEMEKLINAWLLKSESPGN